jgi:hypothetical protein
MTDHVGSSTGPWPVHTVHTVPTDPGTRWVKDAAPAIETPPDDQADPLPEARWPQEAKRTGVCGVVTPNVVPLPGGGFRMYYSQIVPRPGFPAGANDYDNATTRILSAISTDGLTWIPEPGVRLSAQQSGPGTLRVVSPEVVPVIDGGSRLRMYYEHCPGPRQITGALKSALKSALCDDGGLTWTVEPGVRVGADGRSFISARVIFLDDGRCRLYYAERGRGICSALSEDGGFTFRPEPGLRIGPDEAVDTVALLAPEVLRIEGAGYRMYYARYGASNRACIESALSDDGLAWRKDTDPAVAPGGVWDAAKASEMCVIRLPGNAGQPARYRMFYEGCDGTAENARGVWRIASVTSK